MIDAAAPTLPASAVRDRPRGFGLVGFAAVLAAGVVYVVFHLAADLRLAAPPTALPFLLLGLALFVALGFEFVNGFHDTANAVATVIYTNSLSAPAAGVCSG